MGTPVVIGNEKRVKETLKKIGLDENFKIEIVNSTDKEKREKGTERSTFRDRGGIHFSSSSY